MKKNRSESKSSVAGFSLIELIATVIVLSIISVVIVSRFSGQEVFEKKAFFNDVVAAARYARQLASSTGCPVQFSVSATGFTLMQGSSCNSSSYTRSVLHPADRLPYQNQSLPSGMSLSTATLVFQPNFSVTGISGDVDINVGSYSFRIYRDSGFVEVL